jgi:hypothetical protein
MGRSTFESSGLSGLPPEATLGIKDQGCGWKDSGRYFYHVDYARVTGPSEEDFWKATRQAAECCKLARDTRGC